MPITTPAHSSALSVVPDLFRAHPNLAILILVAGCLLTIWGVLNLTVVKHRSRGSLLSQALLSLIPAGLGLMGVFRAHQDFLQIAQSSVMPAAEAWQAMIALAIGGSVMGSMMTLLCGGLGWLNLALYTGTRRPPSRLA